MFPLLIKAVKAEGLKPPEKAILIQIADLTNQLKGKQAWPSEEYLAVKTGFGRKTVSRAKKSFAIAAFLVGYRQSKAALKTAPAFTQSMKKSSISTYQTCACFAWDGSQ